jgi:cytochrome d ubiquinol oxidase subunit I
VQIYVGDLHGLNTLEHQPQKVAAMEALWETQKGAPLVLFALPNEETRTNDYAIEIPKAASLILTHDAEGELKGLNEFVGNHPPVAPVFWAFRIMVGTGILMLLVSWTSAAWLYRHKNINRTLAIALLAMVFSGWIATVSGWYVTEIGRQPWLVTGVLKTVDAISDVPGPVIGISLSMYLLIYAVLMVAFISTIFYMARKAGQAGEDLPRPSSGQAIVKALAD